MGAKQRKNLKIFLQHTKFYQIHSNDHFTTKIELQEIMEVNRKNEPRQKLRVIRGGKINKAKDSRRNIKEGKVKAKGSSTVAGTSGTNTDSDKTGANGGNSKSRSTGVGTNKI